MKNLMFKTETFEGPLELLFHLIEKHKIDIYDIPIALLTDQYLIYMNQMESKDMESMSEFLVMAATLLEIKSRMLLPKQKQDELPEEDPREALVQRLLEYKRYKEVTTIFLEKEKAAEKHYFKEPDPLLTEFRESEDVPPLDMLLNGVTIQRLYQVFSDVMRKNADKTDKFRSTFRSVVKDIHTVENKIQFLKNHLILRPRLTFQDIFKFQAQKLELVVTFLALLELIRSGYVEVEQAALYDDIIIMRCDGSDEFEAEPVGVSH